ncbi:MAG: 30S ribosomal protein S9 [Desulfurococcaceae archaeon]|jgi:small subunit ribosomal protein S9|nr:MAG: 30S ribosomal protein S9 [Desulfurococcaceae archaeon]
MSEQEKIVIATGRRKTAIARAVIRKGSGRVRINGTPVELIPIEVARIKIMEPLLLLGKKIRESIDIDVKVSGGGFMSQAEACRMAIARGLVSFFSDLQEIAKIFREYDRTMLSGDPRGTEPEKWMRYSARRFRQKSYR